VLVREVDARRSGIDAGAVRPVPLLAHVPLRPHLAPALSGLRVEVRAALVRRADAAQVRVAAEVGRVGCRREQRHARRERDEQAERVDRPMHDASFSGDRLLRILGSRTSRGQ